VNDKDGFVCNVWRAIQYSPKETAEWCDWPVNHADLIARRKTLLSNEDMLLENLCKDDKWHDVKLAGYFIWAASCWIGSGLTCPNAIPHLSNKGKGVHAVWQRPHLSDKGKGLHAVGKSGGIYDWFAELSARLRRVRVVCGDWSRVCGGEWQDNHGVCGMFFDPPYGVTDRCVSLYHHDSTTVAADVMAWVRDRGQSERYRIVLAGYEEYMELLGEGWTAKNWKTGGGYSKIGNGAGKENAKREHLYFSPHCVGQQLGGLFA
jgi:hypothetical protein